MEDQPEKKSYRMVWIAAASLGVFMVVLGGAIYLVMQTSPKKEVATQSPATSTDSAIASKEQVKKDIDDATARLKQAAADQAAVKAAIGDNKNQIKVGN
jgi:flagellar basal body-associated protein FliL